MEDNLNSTLASELAALESQGLRRRPRRQDSAPGPWAVVDGRRLLNLGSNNYLGLAGHPALRRAAHEAIDQWGTGSTGSRLTTGNLGALEDMESDLAAFMGTESAILFSSGYAANTGVIPALARRGDLILSDALNHGSIIDGCRLSGVEVRIYRHRDVEHARELLQDRDRTRRCLLVTDGVFSMDGDLAPLPALCDLCDETGAWMMVDDAHGIGVIGERGRGTIERFGLTGRVPVALGTLGKAFGAEGSFVAGSRVLIDYLRNRARTFLFSTAPAPASGAAARAALTVMQAEPDRWRRLLANAVHLRTGLRALGLDVPDGDTPIIPVMIGASERAVRFAQALEDSGVWVPAIRPPTVPEGTARLRVTVTAEHTPEDFSFALTAFSAALKLTVHA